MATDLAMTLIGQPASFSNLIHRGTRIAYAAYVNSHSEDNVLVDFAYHVIYARS